MTTWSKKCSGGASELHLMDLVFKAEPTSVHSEDSRLDPRTSSLNVSLICGYVLSSPNIWSNDALVLQDWIPRVGSNSASSFLLTPRVELIQYVILWTRKAPVVFNTRWCTWRCCHLLNQYLIYTWVREGWDTADSMWHTMENSSFWVWLPAQHAGWHTDGIVSPVSYPSYSFTVWLQA